MEIYLYIGIAAAFAIACVLTFVLTPAVNKLAFKVGAVDVPKDDRRMHGKPIARLGGLAMFLGFIFSQIISEVISKYFLIDITSAQLRGIILGAVVIMICGVLDDIFVLKPLAKFSLQVCAAIVPVLYGVRVSVLSNFNIFSSDTYFNLGILEIPVTILWIVGIINAVNLIDGLDGLAVGVSTIASFSMLIIAILLNNYPVAVLIAALTGACIGFMPYNMNPAKIFMGETGAAFLGYILATASIQGLFKMYAVVSFAVPFVILGLPIFDVAFAIVRRIFEGRKPWQADRGHIHHRLVDLGFNQKQSVAILYIVSAILGISAVVMTSSGAIRAIVIILTALVVAIVAANIYMNSLDHKEKAEKAEHKGAEKGDEGNTVPAGEVPDGIDIQSGIQPPDQKQE